MSYQELDDLSDRLAFLIKESQQPIVLYGHMSPYMIVSMIGAIKAGCGYVPIDTSVPDDRTAMIIEKAAPEYILDASQEAFDFQRGKVITIEDIQNTTLSEPVESRMTPEDIVYTILLQVLQESQRVYKFSTAV